MPASRMDLRMIKEVLRLKLQAGLSHQRIAQALRISKVSDPPTACFQPRNGMDSLS
jgi:hypothetical protein